MLLESSLCLRAHLIILICGNIGYRIFLDDVMCNGDE